MWKEATKIFPVLTVPELEIEKKCRTVFRYTISKGQINLKGLRYKSQALATLNNRFKEKVTVYVDQLDLSSIYIQDPFDEYNLIPCGLLSGVSQACHIQTATNPSTQIPARR